VKLYGKAICRATGSEKIIRAVKKIERQSEFGHLVDIIQKLIPIPLIAGQTGLRRCKMKFRNAKNFNVCGKSVAPVETLVLASLYSGGIQGPGI
jgi:hypothetical protein